MLSSVSPDVAPLAFVAALVTELLATFLISIDTDASSKHLRRGNVNHLCGRCAILFLVHSDLFNDFLSVNDIYTLCGVQHSTSLQVVDDF